MDLSIIIPARNEEFLNQTILDIVKNRRSNTEVWAIVDGGFPLAPIPQYEGVNVVILPVSIGQRAATNLGAKLSTGEWLMKVDAHCAFDEGFDTKMLEAITPSVTMVPVMLNLHAFNRVCSFCGFEEYQGPTWDVCPKCHKTGTMLKELVWQAKDSPKSTAYMVTPELEFKYFNELKARQTGALVETMSLQGSCFMLQRDKYFGLNICDETWGSWGGQGAEVALKTWLSGGRVVCNRNTWYAHMFRTQGGDFSFPYDNPGNEQKKAKDKLRATFLGDHWEHQIKPLSWLVERFWPVPGWEHPHPPNHEPPQTVSKANPVARGTCKPSKGIVYYTTGDLAHRYTIPVRRTLQNTGLPLVVVSLRLDDTAGLDHSTLLNRVYINREPGYKTMFHQILAGLRNIDTEIVFFAEHDVLYHPAHFEFSPVEKDVFYYNENVWKVHAEFGFGLHYRCRQTSGLCAYRDLLIDHYERRLAYIEEHDTDDRKAFTRMIRRMGFEPGTHGRIPELKGKSEGWMSEYPNLDIRHNENLTPTRWRQDQFRNKRYCQGWTMSDTIPGWGKTLGRFDEVLKEITDGT